MGLIGPATKKAQHHVCFRNPRHGAAADRCAARCAVGRKFRALVAAARERAMSAVGLRVKAPASPYQRRTPTLWRAIGLSIWDALAAMGQRRAARALREIAQRWESIDPAVAKQLRDASRHDTRS
jgi:hypothetical protein